MFFHDQHVQLSQCWHEACLSHIQASLQYLVDQGLPANVRCMTLYATKRAGIHIFYIHLKVWASIISNFLNENTMQVLQFFFFFQVQHTVNDWPVSSVAWFSTSEEKYIYMQCTLGYMNTDQYFISSRYIEFFIHLFVFRMHVWIPTTDLLYSPLNNGTLVLMAERKGIVQSDVFHVCCL